MGLQNGAAEWVIMDVGYGVGASSITVMLCEGVMGMAPVVDSV